MIGTSGSISLAQDRKVWASGAARSVFLQNDLDAGNDSVTARKLNSGHALVDLAVNAKPNDQTYLHAMVRIRNDFGGFWGSGITFDMRQLYLKGLIKDAIRYQVGDINYKLTPYTFFNHDEELSSHRAEALDIYRDLTRYDLFYTGDNTWRQQGAAVDFGLDFPGYVKGMEFNMFAFRNRPTDFGNQSERIFFGGNATLQTQHFTLGGNYVDITDLVGTSQNDQSLHNPVVTANASIDHEVNELQFMFRSESGISQMYTLDDPLSGTLRDYFYDVKLNVSKGKNVSVGVNYLNVGADFRSVGAQNKRVNFEAQNLLYTRIGNEQVPRPITQLDLIQDASLYRQQLRPGLQMFAPQYDNILPFGTAIPNRKGLVLDAEYISNDRFIQAKAGYKMLSEVVGQGTENLRTFNSIDVAVDLGIDTLIPNMKRTLELSLALTTQQTSRDAEIMEGDIDLSSLIADIGLKIGIIENMDLVGNYRVINSSGNELLAVRDVYTEVVDFQEFSTDMQQEMLTLALRYHFDDNNALNAVWQTLNFKDSMAEVPDYSVQQFGIVYSMKF